MIDSKIIINVDKSKDITIQTVQYDNLTRNIIANIYGNNMPIDLTNCLVVVNGSKPSGKEIFNSCEVLNAKAGQIKITLTEQILIESGSINCRLKIFNDAGGILSTMPFRILIESSLKIGRAHV